jgi:hypothetical protein
MSKAYKKLGKVADGRIRKNWPVAPPFGPIKKYSSVNKGFENHLEPKAPDSDEEEEEEVEDEVPVENPHLTYLKTLNAVELELNNVSKDSDGNFFDEKGSKLLFDDDPKAGWVAVSCFKLAVLQCLMHVPEFIHYLSREERCSNWRCWTEPINETNAYRCVYCALRDLAQHYWSSTVDSFKQKKVRAVHAAMESHEARNPGDPNNGACSQLIPGKQHDSHEYFLAMVSMLRRINEPHRIDEIFV